MDINNCVISGRLVDDPDLHYVTNKKQEEVAVCRFPIASNRDQRNVDYIPVITWRGYAEHCANYLQKGQEVMVQGKLQSRKRNDNGVTIHEIHAEKIKFGKS